MVDSLSSRNFVPMEPKELYTLFHRHLQVWTEPNANRRQTLIPEVYTSDMEMTDVHLTFRGSDHIHNFVDNLLSRFPGCTFSLTRPLEHHHDVVRAFWQFGKPGQPPATTGQDIIVIQAGKIHRLYVFLDGFNVIQEQ